MHFRSSQGTTTTFGISRLAGGTALGGPNIPVSRNVNISPGTRSLMIAVWTTGASPSATNVYITANGNQSGIEYHRYLNLGSFANNYNFPGNPDNAGLITPVLTIMPCYGAIDTSVTVSITYQGSQFGFSIIESANDVVLGSPEVPVSTIDPLGQHSTVAVGCPNGAVTAVLAVPPRGFLNQITVVSSYAATTAFGVALLVAVATDSGGGTRIITAYAQATGLNINWSGTMNLATGLWVSNQCGVNVNTYIVYRLIPVQRSGY